MLREEGGGGPAEGGAGPCSPSVPTGKLCLRQHVKHIRAPALIKKFGKCPALLACRM